VHIDRYRHGPHQIVFYTLLWSPLTKALEDKYVKFDWAGPMRHRAWVDRKLKRDLVDQSFTDAIAYAGPFRDHMQYSVAQGLCAVLTNTHYLDRPCDWSDLSPPGEVYVITHSLGSILLLETLVAMADQSGAPEAAAEEFIWRTRFIALLANQFPLFRLARITTPEPLPVDAPLSPNVDKLFSKRDRNADLPRLAFVAFSDPNDLLSFSIPDDWKQSLFPDLAGRARFINVAVNNTWPLAGIVAAPSVAHTGYWTNDWIIDLLANGSIGVQRTDKPK
jgi:hypothetical protein